MTRTADKMLEITEACRSDLRLFEDQIATFSKYHSLTKEEYQQNNQSCYDFQNRIKRRIHLLTTILETNSTDILNSIMQQPPTVASS